MPHPRTAPWPAISAHRGGGEVASAGTWEAFHAALDAPTEYVEFDVRRTADGTWVIYHDSHATAPGGGGYRRPVHSLHYGQLCEYAGYLVPEATSVMERLADRVIGHLDLKEHRNEEAIIGPASDIFGVDGFVATTEHAPSIGRIRSFAPAVRTALSTGRRLRLRNFQLRRFLVSGANAVALNHYLATDLILETFRRYGMGVLLWTVNECGQVARHLADTRIDVLITDRPRYASSVRSELSETLGVPALCGVSSADNHMAACGVGAG